MSKSILVIAGFSDSLVGFRKPLIKALIEKELIIHVVAPDLLSNHKVAAELSELGAICHDVPMQRAGMDPMADLKTLFSLWKLMRKISPDYVLGYTIKPVVYGSIAAWISKVPNRFALITGLGFAFMGKDGERSGVRALAQGLYRTALKRCHKVFFQNPDDEALFRELNILKKSTLSCVVNGSGVDVSLFNIAPFVKDSPVRFLLIARLLGDKGVREYAQAAIIVKKLYPQAQFDLVGWIDENPNSISQSELDSWVSSGAINFLGRLSDVKPAIKDCSVYVLPSYREGTPRTVLEAMSMGRAVITTDAPGCRETVVEGDNGFLVPIKNSEALSKAMIKFIEKPELAQSMGKRSRFMAEEKYDVQKVNEQMLKGMGL
jgi:glycosyltransferase involved in cell wall biosynthesis